MKRKRRLLVAATMLLFSMTLLFTSCENSQAENKLKDSKKSFASMNESQCRDWLETRGVVYPDDSDGIDWDGFALEYARLIEKDVDYPTLYNYTVASDFIERIRNAIVQ